MKAAISRLMGARLSLAHEVEETVTGRCFISPCSLPTDSVGPPPSLTKMASIGRFGTRWAHAHAKREGVVFLIFELVIIFSPLPRPLQCPPLRPPSTSSQSLPLSRIKPLLSRTATQRLLRLESSPLLSRASSPLELDASVRSSSPSAWSLSSRLISANEDEDSLSGIPITLVPLHKSTLVLRQE